MNLEEAKANIGAEVELDESTKPYTYRNKDGVREHRNGSLEEKFKGVLKIDYIDRDRDALVTDEYGKSDVINPRHLKLKPQNYKIHVLKNMDTNIITDLFFEIGYKFFVEILNENDSVLLYVTKEESEKYNLEKFKEITLQDLRDMVAKKKQKQAIQESVKPIVDGLETSVAIQDFDSNSGEDKTMQVTGTFHNFEPRKEMTWQDAFQAKIDGKDVEIKVGGKWLLMSDYSHNEFRLAPQRITLNGEHTKEEWLKILDKYE